MSSITKSKCADFAPPQFGRGDVEVLEDKLAFSGFFDLKVKRVRHKKFAGGWTGTIEREVFTKTEAAGALLYDPVHDLIALVEQFRAGALESEFGPWCLELVAGMMDKQETPEALVRRELVEEAGIEEVELLPITAYYSTPGACNEKIHLFCGLCDLSHIDDSNNLFGLEAENEDIRLHAFEAQSVFGAMLNSRANNAATLICLQWLQINREELRAQRSTS